MFATSSARRFRVAAITAATSACLILGRAETGTAQEDRERRIVTQDAQECPTGSVWRGDLGIEGLECNCSFSVTRSGEMEWHFRSEPVIRGVREGGVADGKLRAGDVITGIDDVLITTSEGGRRFANVRPGQRVTLMVRRNERIARVHVVAGSRCEALPALVPGEPFVPAEPAEPLELEVAEPVPAHRPSGGSTSRPRSTRSSRAARRRALGCGAAMCYWKSTASRSPAMRAAPASAPCGPVKP